MILVVSNGDLKEGSNALRIYQRQQLRSTTIHEQSKDGPIVPATEEMSTYPAAAACEETTETNPTRTDTASERRQEEGYIAA
jgi:hypothetical protein